MPYGKDSNTQSGIVEKALRSGGGVKGALAVADARKKRQAANRKKRDSAKPKEDWVDRLKRKVKMLLKGGRK